MSDHDIVTCEGCGVRYAADIAENTCPVCGRQRAPLLQSHVTQYQIERINEGLDDIEMEYDPKNDRLWLREKRCG